MTARGMLWIMRMQNKKKFVYKNWIHNYLFCVCCAVSAVAIAPAGKGFCANAQTSFAGLSFEVATVKPVVMDAAHPFDPKHFWVHIYPGRAYYWSMKLDSLIAHAYDIESFQVTGPEWTNVDHFDIEAKFPEGAEKKDERRMLQALLKDRFKLAFHIEERKLDGYALVVGKHGKQLKSSPPNPASVETAAPSKSTESKVGGESRKSEMVRNPDGSSTIDMGKKGTQTVKFDQENLAMHYERNRITMEELAERLSTCLGSGVHKIVNETEITGTYQVAYDCPLPRGPQPLIGSDADGTPPSDPQGYSALTRSLDKLGLKLKKRKILQQVYVIDHVEKPSEN